MQYDLVMEGGGAKGIALAGAMRTFLNRGHMPGRVLGTSAGAITAALVAAGYTSDEMLTALNEKVDGEPIFATFMSTPGGFSDEEISESAMATYLREIDLPLISERWESRMDRSLLNALMMHPGYRHLFSFVERGGWYAADNFLIWMARMLDSGRQGGKQRAYSGLTMEEFFGETGVHLTVIASDTTGRRMLVLNHLTAPDLPLIWAVRMSMSIPFVWPEVEWRSDWGLYRGDDLAGHTVIDGGVLSNFPIELFISDLPHVTALMGPKGENLILGLLIDEAMAVPDAPPAEESPNILPRASRIATVRRFQDLLNTTMMAHDKMVMNAYEYLVVRLPAKDYGSIEFDMSDERREAILTAGENAMATFLDRPMPGMIPLPADQANLLRQQMQAEADQVATRILER